MHGRSDGLIDDLGVETGRPRVWEYMNADVPFFDLALCLLELQDRSALRFSMHDAGEW